MRGEVWALGACKRSRPLLVMYADCLAAQVTLAHLVELLPRLKPRYYSISSASVTHPKNIHVTAVVVKDDPREGGRIFKCEPSTVG